MPVTCYRLDGGYNPTRVGGLALACVLVGALAGVLYSYLDLEAHFALFIVLLWPLTGSGGGRLLNRAGRWAHNRNRGLALGLATWFTLAWSYAAWATYCTLLPDRFPGDPRHLVLNPLEIADFIQALAHGQHTLVGWHSPGPHPVSVLDAGLLLLETGGMLVLTLLPSREYLAVPYFPRVQAWGVLDNPWPGYWARNGQPMTRPEILADTELRWTEQLVSVGQQRGALSFMRHTQEGQPEVYLTVLSTREVYKNKRVRLEDQPLVANILLDQQAMARLEDRFSSSTDEAETADAADQADTATGAAKTRTDAEAPAEATTGDETPESEPDSETETTGAGPGAIRPGPTPPPTAPAKTTDAEWDT